MRIAIAGTRGIPANYGGFETFAEELSVRLVQRGHDVTVYGRSNFIRVPERKYRGVRLVILPTVRHKYLDTPVHTFLSTIHAIFQKYDVILYCNSANAMFTFLPRLFGTRVALNVDGLEWKRAKWGFLGKTIYRFSEFLATFLPNCVVTDAKEIQHYYRKKFNALTTCIPYGAPEKKIKNGETLQKYGLRKGEYVLYVSRLEPENNAHVVVKAFEKVKTPYRLVVVGDAPYGEKYIRKVKDTKDPRIIFTGFIFGEGYAELQSNAYCYIQATEVGGTHPALVEAMGYGNCILANDVPQHREVLGDAGMYFSVREPDDLKEKLQYLLDHPETVHRFRTKVLQRVREKYSWEKICSEYETLFSCLLGLKKDGKNFTG